VVDSPISVVSASTVVDSSSVVSGAGVDGCGAVAVFGDVEVNQS
jgi:hypothetical protein